MSKEDFIAVLEVTLLCAKLHIIGLLNDDEMEKLKDLMYSTAIKAEQEGLQLGIKIFIRLMLELFSKNKTAHT